MSFYISSLLLLVVQGMLASNGDCQKHPCIRACKSREEPRECYYEFILEHYNTLGAACGKCPFKLSDCFKPHCIAADGVDRTVMVANRQIPGPMIWVCENDMINVKVISNIPPESYTIHWHGVHQRDGFALMDGAPMITQCPILPHTSFTYRFKAFPAGSRFWHSHTGHQMADGLQGPLIIAKDKNDDPNGRLYDYDRPEHVIHIMDWMNESTALRFTKHEHQGYFADQIENRESKEVPESILINGKGQYKEVVDLSSGQKAFTPRAIFKVRRGRKYRFRVINGGIFTCPILFSIDGHKLTVIATEGHPIKPYTVDAFVMSSAERFDFILDAREDVDNYWIKTKGLVDCSEKEVRQAAILRYKGASNNDPSGGTSYSDMSVSGTILNPINTKPSNSKIPVTELVSTEKYPDVTGRPDVQIFMSYNTTEDDSPDFRFHDPLHRPLTGVPPYDAPQLNDITLKTPPFPLLHQFYDNPPSLFCNKESLQKMGIDCKKTFCECAHTLKVGYKDLVEIVLVDESPGKDSLHPMHLHGFSYRVVAMKKFSHHITVDDVKKMDRRGQIDRNLKHAVLKDTVNVPNKGYTVIRFYADNPGVWLFHCHLIFHSEKGMVSVIQVGEPEQFPGVPRNFPRCGNWEP